MARPVYEELPERIAGARSVIKDNLLLVLHTNCEMMKAEREDVCVLAGIREFL